MAHPNDHHPAEPTGAPWLLGPAELADPLAGMLAAWLAQARR